VRIQPIENDLISAAFERWFGLSGFRFGHGSDRTNAIRNCFK
jgi:hypothetical protein